MPSAAAVIGKYVLRLGAVLLLAACRDRGSFPTDVPDRAAEPEIGASRRSVVLDPTPTSCGMNCVLVPGDVPGTSTRPLSTGPNRYTAENSVVWPDTLANATVMLMRVNGVIPRAYVGSMSPSFAHRQGTPYKPIDADGAFSGNFCFGEIRTDFRIFGNREYTLRSCTLSSNNNDADNLVVAEKVTVGRLRGSGTILRTGMNQPTWPGWFNCLNGPCVIAAEAQQTITMHPWMDKLALNSTPTEVFEGDSVSFTPSVSGGMTMIAGSQRWAWVPHKRAIGGQVQADPPDTQTGVCAAGIAICRVRVFRTGNMYLRANLNPATTAEQAFAKVVVKPLTLIARPTPEAVGSTLDQVKVYLRTAPTERAFASISISVSAQPTAFRRSSLMAITSGTASCDASVAECLVSGSAPALLTVTAVTVTGVALTTSVEVGQLPCPTGDPLLDNQAIRSGMDSLWKTGGTFGVDSARRERTGLLIDSAGSLVMRYLPLNAGSSPCTTRAATHELNDFRPPRFLPGIMKVVATFHTHPFEKDSITPNNCNALSGLKVGTGPSPGDWHTNVYQALDLNRFYGSEYGVNLLSPDYRHVVIEQNRIWLMKEPATWNRTKDVNGRTVYVPGKGATVGAVQAWDRTMPTTSQFCVARNTAIKPTFNP